MKSLNLSLILFVSLLSGCGNYKCTYQVYSNESAFDLNAEINIIGNLEPTLVESKSFLGFPKSDLYSTPYTLSFDVYAKQKPASPLLIHSIILKDERSHILELIPDDPLTFEFKKRNYYQANYSTNLTDQLKFIADRKLKLVVDWEILGLKERQIYETDFIGKERVDTHPAGESILR